MSKYTRMCSLQPVYALGKVIHIAAMILVSFAQAVSAILVVPPTIGP